MDFSEVNTRRYRHKPGPQFYENILAGVVLVVIAALVFTGFKIYDVTQENKMGDIFEKAVAAADSNDWQIRTTVKLPSTLHSANYILLRLPGAGSGFEGKAFWGKIPASAADITARDEQHNLVLMEKAPDARMYPASMAKVLTAITVLEHAKDLDQKLTVTDRNFNYFYQDGAAIAGFRQGEKVSVRDLLYGLMLLSGSECASALAIETAGSEEEFVALMNETAAMIGMADSHFTNPVGLFHPENYSTVSDIALLLDYALQNNDFEAIFTALQYVGEPSAFHPNGMPMQSSLFQTGDVETGSDATILGGKTGFTDESGQCLVSLLSKSGIRFILVTAAAMPGNSRTQALHVEDMVMVLNSIEIIPADTELK